MEQQETTPTTTLEAAEATNKNEVVEKQEVTQEELAALPTVEEVKKEFSRWTQMKPTLITKQLVELEGSVANKRDDYGDLNALADDIQERGQETPVVVMRIKKNSQFAHLIQTVQARNEDGELEEVEIPTYGLIGGHRRTRAIRMIEERTGESMAVQARVHPNIKVNHKQANSEVTEQMQILIAQLGDNNGSLQFNDVEEGKLFLELSKMGLSMERISEQIRSPRGGNVSTGYVQQRIELVKNGSKGLLDAVSKRGAPMNPALRIVRQSGGDHNMQDVVMSHAMGFAFKDEFEAQRKASEKEHKAKMKKRATALKNEKLANAPKDMEKAKAEEWVLRQVLDMSEGDEMEDGMMDDIKATITSHLLAKEPHQFTIEDFDKGNIQISGKHITKAQKVWSNVQKKFNATKAELKAEFDKKYEAKVEKVRASYEKSAMEEHEGVENAQELASKQVEEMMEGFEAVHGNFEKKMSDELEEAYEIARAEVQAEMDHAEETAAAAAEVKEKASKSSADETVAADDNSSSPHDSIKLALGIVESGVKGELDEQVQQALNSLKMFSKEEISAEELVANFQRFEV